MMLSGMSNTGSGGGDMPAIAQFEVYTATNPSYQMAGGLRYIPLTQGATDTIEMQCVAPLTGTATLTIVYAMSAANAGNVELYVDRRISQDGDDPDEAATTGSQFVVTPGSVTTRQVVDSADNSALEFSVTEGDLVYLKIGRTADAQDTHTGDARVFGVHMKVTP